MSKQDRQGVRTAKDLEQKYTFGSIKDIESRVEVQGKTLSGVETEAKQQAEDIKKVNGKTAVAQSTADQATNSAQVADDKAETAIKKADKAQDSADKAQITANRATEGVAESKEGIGLLQQDMDALKENLEANYATKEEIGNIAGGGDVVINVGWDEITSKPTEFPPSDHNHSWDGITNKPTTFPPSEHNHDGVYATPEYVDNAVQNAGGGGSGEVSKACHVIRIHRSVSTTNVSTSYNYFNPLTGTPVADIQEGNLSYALQTIATYGDRSNFEVGGVLVGAGISKVRVTANIAYENKDSSTTLLDTSIHKLSNGVSTPEAYTSCRILDTERMTQMVSAIIDVAEGDFIYLMSYKGLKSRDIDILATVNGIEKASQICVEAIG